MQFREMSINYSGALRNGSLNTVVLGHLATLRVLLEHGARVGAPRLASQDTADEPLPAGSTALEEAACVDQAPSAVLERSFRHET